MLGRLLTQPRGYRRYGKHEPVGSHVCGTEKETACHQHDQNHDEGGRQLSKLCISGHVAGRHQLTKTDGNDGDNAKQAKDAVLGGDFQNGAVGHSFLSVNLKAHRIGFRQEL